MVNVAEFHFFRYFGLRTATSARRRNRCQVASYGVDSPVLYVICCMGGGLGWIRGDFFCIHDTRHTTPKHPILIKSITQLIDKK